ncbi:DNA damage-inducible protein 1 [Yamadazyma tenuis]|uniref:DNA damage-inducible protein 1 n=1 Tax=Candida tenuis TaxID=2315449 RepID=UPI002798D474|nr:DNA damage-inducible protein 1 [Yamadazyma tenuis]
MKLTISNETDRSVLSVEISEAMSFEDFKVYLEAETDIATSDQIVILNTRSLQGDSKSLEELGLKDNDLITLNKRGRANPPSTVSDVSTASATTSGMDGQIEIMRQQLLNNSQARNQMLQSNPQMERALEDPEAFKSLMKESLSHFQNEGGYHGGSGELSAKQQEEMRRLEQDPDNPDNQAKILELIRQEQIETNMRLAYDISPESFIPVSMLYIKIKVNGNPVQAFVDSGAQQTIISPRLAEKVGIDRLIDRRFVGEARGVGSTQILGKIHSVPIRIGDSNIDIPCSFSVIDTAVDLLFGLDMLKAHKCLIDLVNNKLVVGSNIETPFLADNEIENNDLLGSTVGNKGNQLGGNIFSDAPVTNGFSPPAKKAPASNAAAAAAAKRQNTGKASSSSSSQSPKYKDQDIQQLIGLGFSRPQVLQALEACEGNVELAASFLFQ